MRMIMIALVVLLLCGGGAAGAYFYFFQSAEASAGTHADEGGKQAKNDHGEAGHYEFVELDPLILPIVDNEGVNQVVSLVVALEVADSETAKRVEAMSPKLKDAYIQDMYGMLNRHAALKGGVIQVGMLKERLNRLSAHVLGDDVVSDVLLQVVQQRPI